MNGSSNSVSAEMIPGTAMNKRMLGVLSLSHILDDLNQGALPTMLPYFIATLGLTYASASGLVLALTITSSVIQPLLGQVSDRHPAPWLVPLGLFCAGAGVALSTLMPSYTYIWLAIGLSGLGVAAFHPDAARMANMAAGVKKTTGMSFFTLGGSAGFALGPLYITPFLLAFGLKGGLFLFVPVSIMAIVLTWQMRGFLATQARLKAATKSVVLPKGKDLWGPFTRLTVVVVCRSMAFYGLNTFIPLYWVDVFHQQPATGGMVLTLLLVCGAVGTLMGGWLGDRVGRRPVVVVGLLAAFPCYFLFATSGDPTISLLALIPLGLTLFAPNSVTVVMGQEYLPNRIGTASGVTLGLAVSVGGLSVPFMGHIADLQGIPAALSLVAFLPLVAGLLAFSLTPRRAEPLAPSGAEG